MNSLEQPDPASLGCKLARVFSHPLCLSLLLAVVTLAVYWRALSCEFIDYDDPDYFSNNPHVLAGLNGSGIRWAFTTYSSANWHPLTWLSLMLDATLFGTGPAGPHLTNVLLHTANAFLLFLVLWRLTMKVWPGAAVAALFALHPLHVESVAWVAERKDVLSGFFFLLTLLAWVRYVRGEKTSNIQHPTSNAQWSYWLAVFFFALGLMSKPMLVTLPLVLLLLDFWPIQRLVLHSHGGGGFNRSTIPRLLFEKLPFFLLSAVSCVITFIAQHQGGAVVGLTRLSVSLRVENAFISYARYLGKTFWPAALANPYPHPEFWLANPPPGFWSAGLVGFSVALFAGLSVAAVWCWRKFPFVTVGWLWYVGTLVPVIGLVQVGTQSMADRYTYLPLIGVFIIVSWGVAELQARWRLSRRGIACLAAVLLVACAARARNQIGFWQNDGELFFHALTVTRNNYVACVNLGTWFSKNGQIEETLRCYYMALKMNPSDPSVLYDVGNAFAKIGYWDEAIGQYRRALQTTPNEADILNNLGLALSATKQYSEAVTNFEAALKLKPDLAGAHNNFATVLYIEHRYTEAAQHYREAIRLTPHDSRIHVNLGDTLVRLGQPAEAAKAYQTALQLNPGDPQITAKLQALDKSGSN
jgi:Tfp pilus assembly protein PilF